MVIESILVHAAGLLLAWIVGAAGLHKLRYPRHYAALIDAYRVLPQGTGRFAAPALGAVEVTTALFVGAAPCLMGGLCAVSGLLLLYCMAIGINLFRGRRDIDCGCGGPLRSRPIAPWMLWRNAALVLLACWLGLGAVDCSAGPREWLAGTVIAGLGVLLYNALDFLMSRDSLLEDV